MSENVEEPTQAVETDNNDALEAGSLDQDLIRSIPVTLTVELGSAKLKLKDLLRLAQGSVLELDTAAGEMLDLKVNGTTIAKGEVVTVGDQLGLTVVEIVSPMERVKPV
ncbi:MAG: flagellar motor switch protein FliN [Pseudomonadota bacterium]|jgi:flagellar motor switch protein FliN/FliY|nr:flagellar motor switch protein FliN [Pseudomonadales bacterium]MEC7139030.1 flagellar motor switch protein FliN [Pseudomonadota bacterium]MEC7251808.1 flagellar motor switch protein FliN [Pseudomonadota bacterium]MEC8480509.1 flagellar motor switch protein FliN [Pseudomonadota bacterium]MEC8696636.1 flagellar motor switch protein FliN [Pseudomonadota bacterium]